MNIDINDKSELCLKKQEGFSEIRTESEFLQA